MQDDAWGKDMGTILHQDRHSIDFYSKELCVKFQYFSTYVWELHAITSVVQK